MKKWNFPKLFKSLTIIFVILIVISFIASLFLCANNCNIVILTAILNFMLIITLLLILLKIIEIIYTKKLLKEYKKPFLVDLYQLKSTYDAYRNSKTITNYNALLSNQEKIKDKLKINNSKDKYEVKKNKFFEQLINKMKANNWLYFVDKKADLVKKEIESRNTKYEELLKIYTINDNDRNIDFRNFFEKVNKLMDDKHEKEMNTPIEELFGITSFREVEGYIINELDNTMRLSYQRIREKNLRK